jgi:hypothetical protein
MNEITVYKLKVDNSIDWSYTARLIERTLHRMIIEARFNRDDHDSGYVVWRRNDRFVEYFYDDRWYNVFEVHDVADDQLKGWYCNITRPALLTATEIRNVDLALDIWIYPDGRSLLLDEDEFAQLEIDEPTQIAARKAVTELLDILRRREPPFDQIAP